LTSSFLTGSFAILVYGLTSLKDLISLEIVEFLGTCFTSFVCGFISFETGFASLFYGFTNVADFISLVIIGLVSFDFETVSFGIDFNDPF
jgi:hypothetical protein